MNGTRPALIYFDMGNVLLRFDHDVASRKMAELAGTSPERVTSVVFDTDLQHRYERGDVSSREFHEIFCRETETNPSLDALLKAAADMFQLNTTIVPVLAALRSAQYRLGILSNTCEAHWQTVSDGRYKIVPGYFEVIALSYLLRAMKPEPVIYERAASLAHVEPQQILFIDDRADNVEAARDAGFDAIHYTSTVELNLELRQRGLEFNY